MKRCRLTLRSAFQALMILLLTFSATGVVLPAEASQAEIEQRSVIQAQPHGPSASKGIGQKTQAPNRQPVFHSLADPAYDTVYLSSGGGNNPHYLFDGASNGGICPQPGQTAYNRQLEFRYVATGAVYGQGGAITVITEQVGTECFDGNHWDWYDGDTGFRAIFSTPRTVRTHKVEILISSDYEGRQPTAFASNSDRAVTAYAHPFSGGPGDWDCSVVRNPRVQSRKWLVAEHRQLAAVGDHLGWWEWRYRSKTHWPFNLDSQQQRRGGQDDDDLRGESNLRSLAAPGA